LLDDRAPAPLVPHPQPANYKRYAEPASLAPLVPGMPPDGVDLMARMLQHDPSRRITAADALEHPFFRDLPEQLKAGGIFGAPAAGMFASAGGNGRGAAAPAAAGGAYGQPQRFGGR
jgi:hypothetical protein